jgi:hypothetical protein
MYLRRTKVLRMSLKLYDEDSYVASLIRNWLTYCLSVLLPMSRIITFEACNSLCFSQKPIIQ